MSIARSVVMSITLTLLLVSQNAISAYSLSVKKDGTGDFTTLSAAVDYLSGFDDTAPKFASTGYVAAGGDNELLGLGTNWHGNVVPGDLISIDGNRYFEVVNLDMYQQYERITIDRNHELGMGFFDYTIVQPNVITLHPGLYLENVNLSGIHFLTITGAGPREAVVIANPRPQTPYAATSAPFGPFPDKGRIRFESLTARCTGFCGVMSGNGGNISLSLSLVDVVLDNVYGSDTIFGPILDSLSIENSTLLGTVDGITTSNTGYHFRMHNSTMYTRWSGASIGGGVHGLRLTTGQDSEIVDSTIIAEGIGTSDALVLFGTGNSVFTIRNSKITALDIAGARAVVLHPNSNVVVENSTITVGGDNAYQFVINEGSSATLICTDADSVDNNGGSFSQSCP